MHRIGMSQNETLRNLEELVISIQVLPLPKDRRIYTFNGETSKETMITTHTVIPGEFLCANSKRRETPLIWPG